MATSTFKGLNTTSITLNAVLDPVVIRRETVLKHLQEQRQLLLDLDFKGGREDQGQEVQQKVVPWFKMTTGGIQLLCPLWSPSYRFPPKARNSADLFSFAWTQQLDEETK